MLLFDGGLALIALAVWVFCIIDVITTPADACRNLPKLVWLLVVVVLLDVGSIAWLVAGRAWVPKAAVLQGASHPSGHPSGYGRPQRSRPTNPDDDEEFLAGLRARAEEQRRRARGEEGGEGTADPGNGPAV
jgi:Phospholipase_D-nuclease N-terminal